MEIVEQKIVSGCKNPFRTFYIAVMHYGVWGIWWSCHSRKPMMLCMKQHYVESEPTGLLALTLLDFFRPFTGRPWMSVVSWPLRSLSSMCLGISVSSRLKYSKVFIMFAFAVSTRLYRIALAFAPLEDSIITKFFRPMVKGRIACSAVYTDIRIICGTSNSSILYW